MAGSTQQSVGQGLWDADRNGGVTLAAAPASYRGAVREARLEVLARAIEKEVVPRLVTARSALPDSGSALIEAPTAEEIAAFATLAMARDTAAALSVVAALRARGAGLHAVCLDLLAPAARHLGDLWVEDRCSFGDVTVGLVRLHEVLNALAPEFRGEGVPRPRARRALLATVPGAQHTFGLTMLAGCFRLAGWSVLCGASISNEHLAGMVANAAFDLIGLSAAAEIHITAVASAIRAVRRSSVNATVGVMVGGPLFVERPELATLVGADATARDGNAAPLVADALLNALRKGHELDDGHSSRREPRRHFRSEDSGISEIHQGLPEPGVVARRSRRGYGGGGDRCGG
jgi:MerR family transcriptional regulator, light-induced transcriptional regulator